MENFLDKKGKFSSKIGFELSNFAAKMKRMNTNEFKIENVDMQNTIYKSKCSKILTILPKVKQLQSLEIKPKQPLRQDTLFTMHNPLSPSPKSIVKLRTSPKIKRAPKVKPKADVAILLRDALSKFNARATPINRNFESIVSNEVANGSFKKGKKKD